MRKPAILITGANGEMGRGLINALCKKNTPNIIGLDLQKLDDSISGLVSESIIGNILDEKLMEQLNGEYEIQSIYHLAALLSTRAEFSPRSAHDVNVGGTLNLLNLTVEQGRSQGRAVKFFFPSSIAVYGLKSLEAKQSAGVVKEDSYCNPTTMYGCNKLYCEHLGNYYTNHYQRLGAEVQCSFVDFRSIRFPGIISANTVPTGGTSDYIPEMLHAAARGENYNCFVREDSAIPFMIMPDAISGILKIMSTSTTANISRTVYNIRAFAPTAGEFREKVLQHFPNSGFRYQITEKRQEMVDSWPMDTDDRAAKKDWDWQPEYDLDSAFSDYLLPELRK